MVEGSQLFIGHRHADSEIARALADFIRTSTAGLVSVYGSSDASFEGPRVGESLNDDLKMVLEGASVFILVYTDQTADWTYTMWEAGLAAGVDDFSTRLVLLQCGPDPPAFFNESVVVDARDRESIDWFVRDLLTAPNFFPERVEPITAFRADSVDIDEWGTRLFEELASVLPIGTQARQFRTTPFVRLGVDAADVQRIREGDMEPEELLDACTVLERASPRRRSRSEAGNGVHGEAASRCTVSSSRRSSRRTPSRRRSTPRSSIQAHLLTTSLLKERGVADLRMSNIPWGVLAGGSSRHTIIERCTIRGGNNRANIGVAVVSGHHLLIRDCSISDMAKAGYDGEVPAWSGIRIEPAKDTASNIRVTNNHISNCHEGIAAVKPLEDDDYLISDVKIDNNVVVDDGAVGQRGILLSRSIDGATITDNVCEGFDQLGQGPNDSSGIMVTLGGHVRDDAGARDVVIARNRCRYNTYGIWWVGAAGAVIDSNICRNNAVGIRLFNPTGKFGHLVHNVLLDNRVDLMMPPASSPLV